MLKIIGISPHPPLIIPAVGGRDLERVRSTVEGLQRLCRLIAGAAPERLVLISPHGVIFRDAIAALGGPELAGDFGGFGAPEVKVDMSVDRELLQLLESETRDGPARLAVLEPGDRLYPEQLDHGAAVPLYYLQQTGVSLPGLHLAFGFLPYRVLYDFGATLRRVLDRYGKPAAVIASGDLSHRLIPGAPAGYNRRGAEFDRRLAELLRDGRVDEILDFDEDLVEAAGECGLRSFIMALGMFSGERFRTEIISYEGPYGVGYLVAALTSEAVEETRAGETGASKAVTCAAPQPAVSVQLAMRALRHYLEHGRPLRAPDPPPPALAGRAGAFVSLKKKGELRGCIGTVEPVRSNLAAEIIANAVSAAVHDPRFPPVRLEELEDISISVDILSPLERVESEADLDPKVYGVLVRSGGCSGLLLPDLEGIDTVQEQIDIARRKAGIAPGRPLELYRFTVTRYS